MQKRRGCIYGCESPVSLRAVNTATLCPLQEISATFLSYFFFFFFLRFRSPPHRSYASGFSLRTRIAGIARECSHCTTCIILGNDNARYKSGCYRILIAVRKRRSRRKENCYRNLHYSFRDTLYGYGRKKKR